MRRYELRVAGDALQDLQDIYDYIADNDSPAKADHVVDRITEAVESLKATPQRGSRPRELLALGEDEYRQVFFKPYRIVYWIDETTDIVHILLIADGRRDLRTLLMRRLLGA
ncbi:MAG: type II toxin-antitoxin system RelE/ParE family toxin [Proteobacteria bacterium]|nr:type II toxin-antitoxin system RelE/ParE family toxin [Pseudomonadota bacterium]